MNVPRAARRPPRPRHRSLVALLLVLLAACGEPDIDVAIPEREGHVADLAGILDAAALEDLLAGFDADGVDIVALTYETEQANCGEAFRAGQQFVQAWDADVALVAVARPGGFDDVDGEPCVGLQPLDDFAVGRGTREAVSEELWPPLIEAGEWDAVFAEGSRTIAEAIGSTS